MSYTLASIVTSVQRRVRDTGYPADEIKEYINEVQNDIFNEYRLNFMEKSVTYTTTPNNADITGGTGLPADYLVGIDLINTTNNNQLFIPYKDVIYLDDIPYQQNSTNPSFWYKYADTISIFPTPSIALTVKHRYYEMPTELENDADIPEPPASFRELFVVGAAYRVLQVKDNYDQAGILQNKYDEILQKLVGQTAVNQVGSSPTQRINRYNTAKRHF